MKKSNLHNLSKDMLIKLLVNVNDFSNLSTEELKGKINEMNCIIRSRKDDIEIFKPIEELMEDEDLVDLFNKFKSQSQGSTILRREEKIENLENDIRIIWKFDYILCVIYKNRKFYPTDAYIGECHNFIRLVHKRKENSFDYIVIFQGEGTMKNPYSIIIGEDHTYNNMCMDLYYLQYEQTTYFFVKSI